MKIAFCFLIYDDINYEELWYNFFKDVDASKYSIYIHYKEGIPLKYFDEHKLDNCIETEYGGVSLVHAQNLLYKEALKDDDNYKMVTLSQSCIPLKSFDHVYDFLTKDDKGHFNISHKSSVILVVKS